MPSRNIVRLEPRCAFRREATCAAVCVTKGRLACQPVLRSGGVLRGSGRARLRMLRAARRAGLAVRDDPGSSASGGIGPTTTSSACEIGMDITLPSVSKRT